MHLPASRIIDNKLNHFFFSNANIHTKTTLFLGKDAKLFLGKIIHTIVLLKIHFEMIQKGNTNYFS